MTLEQGLCCILPLFMPMPMPAPPMPPIIGFMVLMPPIIGLVVPMPPIMRLPVAVPVLATVLTSAFLVTALVLAATALDFSFCLAA